MHKPDPTREWYYTSRGVSIGPISFEILKQLAAAGKLDRSTDRAWCSASLDWIAVSEIEGLFSPPSETSPAPPRKPPEKVIPVRPPPPPPADPPAHRPNAEMAHEIELPSLRTPSPPTPQPIPPPPAPAIPPPPVGGTPPTSTLKIILLSSLGVSLCIAGGLLMLHCLFTDASHWYFILGRTATSGGTAFDYYVVVVAFGIGIALLEKLKAKKSP